MDRQAHVDMDTDTNMDMLRARPDEITKDAD
jgi:hypothetical protein